MVYLDEREYQSSLQIVVVGVLIVATIHCCLVMLGQVVLLGHLFFIFSRGGRLTMMSGSLLLGRQFEVGVAWLLAFFVVSARTDLGTLLRLAVGVFEAPVPDLEVSSLSILLLLPVRIVVGIAVVFQVIKEVSMETLAHMVHRVRHLADAATAAVMV